MDIFNYVAMVSGAFLMGLMLIVSSVPVKYMASHIRLFWVMVVTSVVFMWTSLISLAEMRRELYEPDIAACESAGGRFYCLHGMCSCHCGER